MKPATEATYKERILRVLVHIQQNLDDALDLDALAKVACFSPYHFHRVFRGMVGESVAEHIRRIRLERAALRLKHGDHPITRVAFDAGYETHEAFTRAFRAMFDMPPSQFRAEHRVIPVAKVSSGIHYSEQGRVDDFTPPGGGQTMDVRIEKLDPIRVAFVRHIGPYHEVAQAWQKLMAWAGPAGLFMRKDAKMLALCHDDPEVTPPDKVRYDACITVGDDTTPAGDIGVQTIDGGEYAVATHHGPYEKLGETYGALCGQWLANSGRELRSAPPFEVYKNNPQNTPPEKLVTDIYLPLA